MFNGRYTFDTMTVAKDSLVFASEYAVFDWGISTIPKGNIQVGLSARSCPLQEDDFIFAKKPSNACSCKAHSFARFSLGGVTNEVLSASMACKIVRDHILLHCLCRELLRRQHS